MDTQRAFIAIVLSLAILLGYQYFFAPPPSQEMAQEVQQPAVDTGVTSPCNRTGQSNHRGSGGKTAC